MTTLIIPAAGAGSRFAEAGYNDPKPFIRPNGVGPCLLEMAYADAVAALGEIPDQTIVLVREGLEHLVQLPSYTVVETVKEVTDGAATTLQLVEKYVPRFTDVMVSNCDQRFGLSSAGKANFKILRASAAAVPLCFKSDGDKKWSYVESDCFGAFKQIVEKPAFAPPDNIATCGVYWFDCAGAMYSAIDLMKKAGFRVNGEFYFAPCHNFLRTQGAHRPIIPFLVDSFQGLGTPADLRVYERSLVRTDDRSVLGDSV